MIHPDDEMERNDRVSIGWFIIGVAVGTLGGAAISIGLILLERYVGKIPNTLLEISFILIIFLLLALSYLIHHREITPVYDF